MRTQPMMERYMVYHATRNEDPLNRLFCDERSIYYMDNVIYMSTVSRKDQVCVIDKPGTIVQLSSNLTDKPNKGRTDIVF